ncbi:MAG: hypothetical protein ACREOZ_00645 [Gloeomargaritales cyanobacterium]
MKGKQMIVPHERLGGVYFEGDLELWTTLRCADELKYQSTFKKQVADKAMRRAGLLPYVRLPGRSGLNLWIAEEVVKLKG